MKNSAFDNKLSVSSTSLKQFEPISNLSPERLDELVSLSYLEPLNLGVSLFLEGDVDNQTIYILKGDVQLTSSDKKINTILHSGSDEAKFPVDDSQPRQTTAVAMSNVEIVRIDNSVLDYMMMWDQLAVSETNLGIPRKLQQQEFASEGVSEFKSHEPHTAAATQDYTSTVRLEKSAQQSVTHNDKKMSDTEVESVHHSLTENQADAVENTRKQKTSIKESRDWIRKIRHIMAFKNMPPANVKQLLDSMESMQVGNGDVIIEQGSIGDYYYILTDGDAKVTRTVELATLSSGAAFGEEALVANTLRNASVTMTSDGTLMRLSKNDFDNLLIEPLLDRVSPDEARTQVQQGAKWLDVRHAKEYHRSRLPSAINIPLHELRLRMDELDKESHYICCCRTGARSSSATFLLVQNGFKASLLSGGIQVMSQDLCR